MKNSLCAALFLLGCTLPTFAEEPTLKQARQRWLHGNYDEARDLYEKLSKDAKQAVAATIGLSRVLQSKGEYAKALETVQAAGKANPKSADLHGREAELLYLQGRWDDAEKAGDATLALDK